jgi:hypothetical protein
MTRRAISRSVAMPHWASWHAAWRHSYASAIIRLLLPVLSPAVTSRHQPTPACPAPSSTRSPDNDRRRTGLRLRSSPQVRTH